MAVRKRSKKTPAKRYSEEPIQIGKIADKDIKLEERIQEFKEAVLSPFVSFFIKANVSALVILGLLAMVDTILVVKGFNVERVVNDKVLISAIAAVAVQTAAIIIAAFKGLFGATKK